MSPDEAVRAARDLGFAPCGPDYGDTPGQVLCEHEQSTPSPLPVALTPPRRGRGRAVK
ncbi:hypothetical protein ACFYWO_04700 [Streptomyces sp. NPDC002932]|uniref:hypothetical protein n=1 Tax=Streptomyces sp. NPDC002932 TaxID=3364672 RepID=UPI0036BE686C